MEEEGRKHRNKGGRIERWRSGKEGGKGIREKKRGIVGGVRESAWGYKARGVIERRKGAGLKEKQET